MRRLAGVFAGLLAALTVAAFSAPTRASLLIQVDKSAQQMTVIVDGDPRYVWPVSTGREGYDTPTGQYKPFRMEKDHFSREWDDAPMPHSIFFTTRGHAIHGSDHVRNLGRPASHGCVRLDRQNAATLFSLVRQEGMANVRVVLSGQVPAASDPAVARRAPGYGDQPGYVGQSYPNHDYSSQGYSNQGYSNQGYYSRQEYDVTSPRPRAYRNDRREAETAQPRSGHWVQQPDGSRVFYDRERMGPPPPPFFAPRPPGW